MTRAPRMTARDSLPVPFRAPLPPDRARRMRRVATGLLVAMAGLFALARWQLGHHPAWDWVLAFSEAALVGGLADWFAVTALFRHPLGVPIPHTAIIPENKDRIADSMARFLQSNFLIPTVVARRMRAMNLARTLGDFLTRPNDWFRRLVNPMRQPQSSTVHWSRSCAGGAYWPRRRTTRSRPAMS